MIFMISIEKNIMGYNYTQPAVLRLIAHSQTFPYHESNTNV